ncbi:hypothetical protein RD792_009746 [Penstemon davidsonii]|uniref:Methyltransferase type 11 domain-containing protein n=1 Tax=Penstemon davidsonii TaxID=160366 RepID=A0ABR0CZZ3_9LAMI|nr:hypothetical protein RD792_009746 [Penstemon davidsonii]
MGKKDNKQLKSTKQNSNTTAKKQEELLKTLGDFTSKENWDQFFTIRGSNDTFEWYAEWPRLRNLLTTHLSFPSPSPPPEELSILVPGCGNSKMSEHLYDVGFKNITNIDFSKVVISDMLRRNVRERPEMKWRIMDMTNMQFVNESFYAILDKGGLDALMEPELGPRLGNLYLSEVKRLLKAGGKFICLTLAESHVLDILFAKFRIGWKMCLHAIAQEPSSRNLKLQTIMVIAEKDNSSVISEISSFTDQYPIECHSNQARELYEALEREKIVRSEYTNGADILYSLEDLKVGAKGNLTELEPGRRVKLTLGEPGVSPFFYKGVLLDAQQESGPFTYQFGVFLVPKTRAYEWLFSSEEGQWVIVESSKAARLVMILLDSSNSSASMEDIQKDLSPLVKQLAPAGCDDGVQIPFMAASDGIKQRNIVHQVTSDLTGPIVVDDVVYEEIDDDLNHLFPSKDLIFRRLTFQRSENLVQSEALLSTEGPHGVSGEVDKKKSLAGSRKKGKQKKNDSRTSGALAYSSEMEVDHNYLASAYHNGIIAGLMLISLHLQGAVSGGIVKTVVIGLGAGLLPMFLKKCLASLEIEVVELDHVVLDLARDYFGFREDERLKVHIKDGIKFVREIANPEAEGKVSSKIGILIVDVDASDSSSGLTCPAADFVEESFLTTVKDSLSEQGLFIINLVSRSSAVKGAIYSRLKKVFSNLFSLQLEEDVNEVIFALKTDACFDEDQISEARNVIRSNPTGYSSHPVPTPPPQHFKSSFGGRLMAERPKFVNRENEEVPYTRKEGGKKSGQIYQNDLPTNLSKLELKNQKMSEEEVAVRSTDSPRKVAGRQSVGSDHSPLHPHSQARVGGVKSSSRTSSPSWERKASSEAPSTPGRSRLRSVTRGDDTPDHSPAVPKFGEWDETDPSAAEGYTHIFNKVREEKHSETGKVPIMPTETSYSNGQKQYQSETTKPENLKGDTVAKDGNSGSGIQVPRKRYISVSKSRLLDAIVSTMFPSQEEEEARQFLSLSQCLDSILHAEHKSILEEMRADFDETISTKDNGINGYSFPANQKGSGAVMDGVGDSEMPVSSDFTLDLKLLLGSSLGTVTRNPSRGPRVVIPIRFQQAFMQLLYNAEFEELSPRDLMLSSALNTDYLLTLPIYVDWKKASESNAIIFRRGYATERQKGLLIAEKLDYLQSKLLQNFFFLFAKPLGKFGVWLNEVFKSISHKTDTEVFANKLSIWLKEFSLFLKQHSYNEQILDDLQGHDMLSRDLPIWVAAQKAVTRYEGILSAVGPRERLLRKFLTWIGVVPSTPQQAFDLGSNSSGSESHLSPSFLSRISLSDIWKPASPKRCGNDFQKIFGTAVSILFSKSILQEPAFQELILLYTEETGGREAAYKAEVSSLEMKIYEKIPIPDLPVKAPALNCLYMLITYCYLINMNGIFFTFVGCFSSQEVVFPHP